MSDFYAQEQDEEFPSVFIPSLTIINKTKPPAWIMQRDPIPTNFKTTLLKQKYWAEEKRRWIEGYNGLPGMFYYYIQNCWIKNRNTGVTFRPIARDVDLLMCEHFEKCMRNHRVANIIKTRGVGFSSITGALGNYFIHTSPGCNVLMTSKDLKGINTLFDEKFLVPFKNMPAEISPEQVAMNNTKQQNYLKYGLRHLADNGEVTYSEGSVYCYETTEKQSSSTAFSGKGGKYGISDEHFLNKRRKDLMRSWIECFISTDTRELDGLVVTGGTVEHTVTDEELSECEDEIRAVGRADTLFLPYWWGKHMVNGHSDREAARISWEKEVEAAEATGDPNEVRAVKKNNPSGLKDIFDLAKGNIWEADVEDLIKTQITNVKRDKVQYTPAKLVSMGGVVEVQPYKGKEPPFIILEDPKPGIKYVLLIDGVATGKNAGGNEGSNVAGVIVKLFDPAGDTYAPVALYSKRPDKIEDSYIDLVNLGRRYDIYELLDGCMAEANAGNADHFSTYLIKQGLKRWIMLTRDLSGKGHANKKKFFNYVNADAKDYQMRHANMFLRKHIQSQKSIHLLEDLLKKGNADFRSAWLMLFIAYPDLDKPLEKPKVRKPQLLSYKVRNPATGAVEIKWSEVPL